MAAPWKEEEEEREEGGRKKERRGKRGPGRSPGKLFLKRDFTPFPGLVRASRLRFWTPLTEISLLVKLPPQEDAWTQRSV